MGVTSTNHKATITGQRKPPSYSVASSVGTLRDTNNFAKQWRKARVVLGETLEKTTGHSFRKTLGNLVTDERADPRIAADMLGHTNVNTTLKHYLQRNRVHHDAAALVDKAVRGTKKGGKRTGHK